MTTVNIPETVIHSLRRLGCDADEILPTHDLQYDLGVDSTEMVELARIVQTQCGIEAQRVNLGGVKTVSDLIAHVESLLATS